MKKITKTILTTTLLSFTSFTASAQFDYYKMSSFEGFYAGIYVGGAYSPELVANIGGVAGVNITIADSILAGAELQGSTIASTPATHAALMLGRIGYEYKQDILLYGAAGSGVINGASSYAFGGGAEAIVAQQVGIRAEGLITGEWGKNIDSSKLSLGVIWHIQ